ncbi:5-formyltetrahydrofolate cyclo-ligase [Paenibacillus sediminis]
MIKQQLREAMRTLRGNIPEEDRLQQSIAACQLATYECIEPLRRKSGRKQLTICSYLPFRDEPDTLPLIRHCWAQGDTVLAPRVDPLSRNFELHEISRESDIEQGTWGIPEPKEDAPMWEPGRGSIDFVLVPGLAFDRHGGRIGYGGGYYDRFLQKINNFTYQNSPELAKPLLGAIVLTGQLIDHIPMEEHDYYMDMLFTSTHVIYTDKGCECNGTV